MEIDEIPELPDFRKEEVFEIEISFEEFKNAKNRLIMSEIGGDYRTVCLFSGKDFSANVQ